MTSKIYFRTYLAYSEAGIVAKLEKKGFWGWSSFNATSIKISGSYVVDRYQVIGGAFCSTTSFNNVSQTNFQDSQAEHLGTTCWGCCSKGTIGGNGTNTVVTCNTSRSLTVTR